MQIQRERKLRRPPLPIKYPGGALRNNRTPGMDYNSLNTLSPYEDLIHLNYLCAFFIFGFCLENETLLPCFPLKWSNNPRPWVPGYVGRDIAYDSLGKEFAGFHLKRPKTEEEHERVAQAAQEGYQQMYGENYHAFWPYMKSGCAHTKMMVLLYPDFVRVVITSANFMTLDVLLGDNTWYIQDFPRIPTLALDNDAHTNVEYVPPTFERDLRRHIIQLGCPEDFLCQNLSLGRYDFFGAKVHLVTSVPGSFSGKRASDYGQLALRRIVRRKILKNYTEETLPKLAFEICTGSVGHLENEDVIKNFLESCSGNLQESIEGKPELKFVFPTRPDVEKSNVGVAGASNISCHIDWRAVREKNAEYLPSIFHHYYSKSPGALFHLKAVYVTRADDPNALVYMYTGSANLSGAAWGLVKPELRNGVIARTMATERLGKVMNFECGVVIAGSDVVRMLETQHWRDIVPYERPTAANKYKEGERPFRVSKQNFPDAPLDYDGDDDDPTVSDAEDDDEAEFGTRHSTKDLVKMLSKKNVLSLVCKA
ncbi:tyrosyl-DNA phosphodiesterase-domain-containing protein [Mycena filopes]|nr:tyrosyl-DNA phosphodiesterase-domain-containing protein [Mycena filopes]